ncbi:hypothetical protein WPS_33520 [Vulcanimicrobium alpinum]|uniref:Uncharacterized protein n=1 Tax=Vulcanimicrobium alpinum TaxID=3016050 RepID=A0AAN1Y023_UNVUL|nr:hypothetical protein [Vulcanimicrobium alpinum]BDE08076.1 hypothetical protein WPS_33520 [Vulcanimicrobium alpinum]
MTDESLFYRRFIEDVRRCAAGRAPASVAEIDLRVQAALAAPPQQRESRWARVVAAVGDLLTAFNGRSAAAGRLREFLRENADLERPRDVAITDFRFVQRVDGVLRLRDGRRVLMSARIPRAADASLDEVVAAPARRAAEWTVYGLCGGAAAAALWFAFVVPV